MEDCVLALKLRPKRLSELVGQQDMVQEIQNQISSGRIPRSWMFVGDSGGGKTTVSKIVALALQKPDYTKFGDDLTSEDWAQYPMFDINEVNASNDNGKNDMAALAEKVCYSPMPPSRFRINILNEAHELTKQAQNLLLDVTETQGNTIWIVVTSEPEKLIVAFQRRFTTFRLRPLDENAIATYLSSAVANEHLVIAGKNDTPDTKALAGLLFQAGITAPGRCVQALEKVLTGSSAEEALGFITSSDLEAREVTRALLKGNWSRIKHTLEKFSNKDLVGFRYQLLGYLTKAVISGEAKRPQQAAEMIRMLTDGAPYEQPALAPWIVSRLFLLATHPQSQE